MEISGSRIPPTFIEHPDFSGRSWARDPMPVIVEDHSFVLGGFSHADAILLGVFDRRIKEL